MLPLVFVLYPSRDYITTSTCIYKKMSVVIIFLDRCISTTSSSIKYFGCFISLDRYNTTTSRNNVSLDR